MDSNNNVPLNKKVKSRVFFLTARAININALFVTFISVSTFFCTRSFHFFGSEFTANILSTSLALAAYSLVIELYSKANANKLFMAGAYAILIVFFISAFVDNFNVDTTTVSEQKDTFLNLNQTILLAVFIAYVVSFRGYLFTYLYVNNDLGIEYIWAKSLTSFIVAQTCYAFIYNIIFFGLSDMQSLTNIIKNELLLRYILSALMLLIIYFVVAGIKSGALKFTGGVKMNPFKKQYSSVDDAEEEYQAQQHYSRPPQQIDDEDNYYDEQEDLPPVLKKAREEVSIQNRALRSRRQSMPPARSPFSTLKNTTFSNNTASGDYGYEKHYATNAKSTKLPKRYGSPTRRY